MSCKYFQTPWRPDLANYSHATLSRYVPKNSAIDCTIHSLFVLGLLTHEKAIELSEEMHQQYSGYKGTLISNVIEFLRSHLETNVEIMEYEKIKAVKKILLKQLKPGNATLLIYTRSDNTAHSIVIYSDGSNLACADIQQNNTLNIDEFMSHEPNVEFFLLFLEKPNGITPMSLDEKSGADLLRGKGIKNKKTKKNRRTTKNKKNKKTKINKHKYKK